MRKITALQIALFVALLSLAILIGMAVTWLLWRYVPLGDFRGVVMTATGIFFVYLVAIFNYRVFLRLFPLRAGDVAIGSSQEFIYHVYILHYLMLFYPLMRCNLLPVPILKLYYEALGAKIGSNSWGPGTLLDPPFIQIGNDCIVGMDAILCPHIIEGSYLAHYPIKLGNQVTIGAGATVLANVEIGDGAIIGMCSLVTKGSRVGAGEVWTGIPARCQRGSAGPAAVAKIP